MSQRQIINPPLVADLITERAALDPDLIAQAFEGTSTTYREMDENANRTANALLALGVQPGDRVAWLAQNLGCFYDALFACARIGAVMTPVNWRLAPAEIAQILQDAEPVLFLAEEQFSKPLEAIDGFVPPRTYSLDTGGPDGFEAIAAGHSPEQPATMGGSDDVFLQLYTSGTTGLPKGVLLTNRAYYEVGASGFEAGIMIPQSDDILMLHALPHFHVAGVNFGLMAIQRRAPIIQLRQFDPAAIVKIASGDKQVYTFLVPAMVMMILEAAKQMKTPLTNFASVAYGAAPMPVALLDAAIGAMPNAEFTQLYGMTETSGGVTALLPDDHMPGKSQRTAAGKALPGCDVKICDPATGAEVAKGETGEIVIKSDFTMVGYWNKPDATNAVIKDGWYWSGDAGQMDENGYVFVVDRIKDMIISGGENIYPAEIEGALSAHPNILEAAIVGAPDDKWGEVVKAVIVTRDKSEISKDDLCGFLSDRIAKFKLPQIVETIDALPRNASGKILKTALRKRA